MTFAAGWLDVVRTRVVPNSLVSSANRWDLNCRQRSVVIVSGDPNTDIHLSTNARATVSADWSGIGMASGQQVYRSTQVNRYTLPLDGESGPTRSICTCAKRASGALKVPRGALTCRNVVDFWQARHCWAHFRTSFLMPGHVKREVTAFTVARTPGCDNPWIVYWTPHGGVLQGWKVVSYRRRSSEPSYHPIFGKIFDFEIFNYFDSGHSAQHIVKLSVSNLV